MTKYVHKMTTAIIFEYFDAILKECIENTLKFLLDNAPHTPPHTHPKFA